MSRFLADLNPSDAAAVQSSRPSVLAGRRATSVAADKVTDRRRRPGRRSQRAALAEQCQQLDALWQQLQAELPPPQSPFPLRCDGAVEAAGQLLTHAPSWIAFYRLVFGEQGVLMRLFPKAAERREFEAEPHFLQLHTMLAALRSQDLPENDPKEPQRMITLRIPKTLHDQMSLEAQEYGLSVNRLCISRLLQPLQVDLVPSTQQRPRGKRPAITSGRWSRSS